MIPGQPLNQLIQTIHALDRDRCLCELRSLERLQLDFTDEFLNTLSHDRLRHVLLRRQLRRQDQLAGNVDDVWRFDVSRHRCSGG